MSAKARFFGLPTAVIDKAIESGAHADCLLFRTRERSCEDCRKIVFNAIGVVYADISPADRPRAMRLDVAKEQAE